MPEVTTLSNGIKVLDSAPAGAGGQLFQDNFTLIDSRLVSYSTTTDPTVNDDGANTSGNRIFKSGDLWVNTSDDGVFVCVDNATSSAVWLEITNQSDESKIENVVEDTTPQLGGNLDLNGNLVGSASAADLTKLSEITATSTELNYVDGVTSNIQTQINNAVTSPAGSDGDLQINNGGSFGTIAGLNLDKTGNARGTNALDIQSSRSAVTQVASGNDSVAIGHENTASNYNSTVVGGRNTVTGGKASAFGTECTASGYYSCAFGYESRATADGAVTFGSNQSASGVYSSAFGDGNTASGADSLAAGRANTASGEYGVAIGAFNTASGLGSTAVGKGCQANEEFSSAFGYLSSAPAKWSTAIGAENYAQGLQSTAIGYSNSAQQNGSTAIGYSCNSSRFHSSAIGAICVASGLYSSAIGYRAKTLTNNTFEAGYWVSSTIRSTAVRMHPNGQVAMTIEDSASAPTDGGATAGSEADGTLPRGMVALRRNGTTLYADLNVAGTITTTAVGGTSSSPAGSDGDLQINNSGSFGTIDGLNLDKTGNARGTDSLDIQSARITATQVASGFGSAAFGTANTASAFPSIAIGTANTASGYYASAFGSGNTASSYYASAFGYENTASSDSSSAFGALNSATAIASSAVGYNCTSSGNFSSAFGFRAKTTIANTFESGYWSATGTRTSAIRMHPNGQVAMTIEDSASAPTDGGATAGSEADGTLARGMFTIQKNGTAVTLFFNNGGTIQSLSLGTLS